MTKLHPIRIFIAYSREDTTLLEKLRRHFKPLEHTEKVEIWYDGNIEAGAAWEEKIKEAIYSADIILLLVSADSISSDYFYGKEVTAALQRQEKGEATVIPLIVRSCDWKRIKPLSNLQAIPQNGLPVTSDKWNTQDDAWLNAIESIGNIVEERTEWKQKIIADQLAKEEEKKRAEREAEETRIRQIKDEEKRREAFEEEIKRREEEDKKREEELKEELTRETNFKAAVAAADQSFASRNWKKATASYNNALALYKLGDIPNDQTLRRNIENCATEQSSEIHVDYARIFFEQKKYKEALEHTKKAIKINSLHTEAKELKVKILNALPKREYINWNYIPLKGIFRFFVFAIIIFIIFFSIKNCRETSNNPNPTIAEKSCLDSLPTRKNVLAEMRKRDTIRIVVEPEAPPFNYIDDNGKKIGFDYEIAKRIALELGIKNVEMIHTSDLDYSEFPCAFNQDIADWFMGGYVKNPDLDNLVSWSDSYYDQNGLALIVKKGSGITDKYELKGKKIAVYDDPASIRYIEKELGAIAKPCIDTADDGTWIRKELDVLGMTAVLYDYPFAKTELNDLDPTNERYKIVEYNVFNMPYVIGIPIENDDLLSEVNEAIKILLEDELWYRQVVNKLPKPDGNAKVPVGYRKHIVVSGETLSGIVQSELNWPPIRYHEVWKWNKTRIPNANLIKPGDEIQLEPPR